jgi:tetratricopeptide (TPR) repeat protein
MENDEFPNDECRTIQAPSHSSFVIRHSSFAKFATNKPTGTPHTPPAALDDYLPTLLNFRKPPKLTLRIREKAYAMKSAHRHELETNVLAHRLEVYIDRYKPYASRIVGVLIAIVAVIFIASYFAGSSSARKSEAWDTFNRTVTSTSFGMPPSLDDLHRTAQEYPGTPMQQIADVTWADAQVYIASRTYLANRPKALETLNAAMSAYEGVLQSEKDDRLIGRARLGLARIYEMQNKLDKAREEYGKVTGAYAKYAQAQAERLGKPDVQETYAWLATAQIPLPKSPAGPGTPGQRPEFSPGEMNLPTTGPPAAPKTEDTKAANDAFDNLLKSLKDDSKKGDSPDRYKDAPKPADGAAPPAKDAPPTGAEKPETKPAEKTTK